MNVVREITRINQTELDIAINNPSASWHEQYKDSAYIFIGGLPYDLTEGDVITIFSQYGEIVDVNLPRANPNGEKPDANRAGGENGSSASSQPHQQSAKPLGKGKHRGFGFLMYEDQRSTVLAVDNLNGAQVLGRTLRVDHVSSYKQPKVTDEEGNRVEAEVKRFNAAPQLVGQNDVEDEHEEQDKDLEDPMASYFQRLEREQRGNAKQSSDDYQEKEEKRRRKEERARIRAEREQRRSGSRRDGSPDNRHRSHRHHNDDDEETEHKRHRSHPSHDAEEAGRQVNRYEQMKKSRSILDTDTPTRTEKDKSSSRRRSRTPPSRDQERRKYRDERDEKHRSSGHPVSHQHHHSSRSSRRRSHSPR